MTVLQILRYPDQRLSTVAKPVKAVDERIRRLVADMAETMYDAPGIGLAATQVDVHERVVVIDVSETKDQLQVFINPELVAHSDETRTYEEGCLSVPGVYEQVDRPERVRVRATDLDGNTRIVEAEELLAVCIQHEIDHLNGKVFVDHLSRLKQSRIRSRLVKEAQRLPQEAPRPSRELQRSSQAAQRSSQEPQRSSQAAQRSPQGPRHAPPTPSTGAEIGPGASIHDSNPNKVTA